MQAVSSPLSPEYYLPIAEKCPRAGKCPKQFEYPMPEKCPAHLVETVISDKKIKWKKCEIENLMILGIKHQCKFNLIAKCFPGRSLNACEGRYYKTIRDVKKVEWDRLDLSKLKSLADRIVDIDGEVDWDEIGKALNKDRLDCIVKWIIHYKEGQPLRKALETSAKRRRQPAVIAKHNKLRWTAEEDKTLKFFAKLYSEDFSKIVLHIPHRTLSACRHRYIEYIRPAQPFKLTQEDQKFDALRHTSLSKKRRVDPNEAESVEATSCVDKQAKTLDQSVSSRESLPRKCKLIPSAPSIPKADREVKTEEIPAVSSLELAQQTLLPDVQERELQRPQDSQQVHLSDSSPEDGEVRQITSAFLTEEDDFQLALAGMDPSVFDPSVLALLNNLDGTEAGLPGMQLSEEMSN